LSRVDSNTAGWLARFILNRMEKERERAGEEIEQELKVCHLIMRRVLSDRRAAQTVCPPREVRNFQVLVVQDACTRRRGANRSAQLTVWGVLELSTEGFQVGQRYAVANLVPSAQSAWMDCGVGSEIYLSTRGASSKWNRLQ
jgi:breast cancer 2 susceptibility protein